MLSLGVMAGCDATALLRFWTIDERLFHKLFMEKN